MSSGKGSPMNNLVATSHQTLAASEKYRALTRVGFGVEQPYLSCRE